MNDTIGRGTVWVDGVGIDTGIVTVDTRMGQTALAIANRIFWNISSLLTYTMTTTIVHPENRRVKIGAYRIESEFTVSSIDDSDIS